MATFNGRNLTPVSGLNINARSGLIRFETPTVTPVTVSGSRILYVNSSNQLIFDSGSGTTVIGAAGGAGALPTWESIFTADATFTITPDSTFTIAGNRSTATDVLTLTNSAGGSGSVLQITNSGTGNDVDGTSNTWSLSKLGAATFLTLALSGTTITSTDNVAWTLNDNSATALVIGASGDASILSVDTSNATPLVAFGKGLSMTDGNATFISTSNTVTNMLVTNNTLTTFGAAANSAGAVCLRSTSLTTGSLLQLQLSDTANVGGFYLNCRESVGGTNDFTIGENGVVTIAGGGAANAFTITAGDVVFSDASLLITDADNAASFSLTNNTATTATVLVVTGSGVFTGTTTTSFMTLTTSGLTTGTLLYVAAAGLTSGIVGDVVVNALTTGKIMRWSATGATDGVLFDVTGGGANMTSTGKIASFAMGAATVGNGLTISTTGVYTGSGLIQLTANSATTGVIAQITANGLTTGSALSVTSSGVVTSSGSGVAVITGSGVTTGYVLQVTDGGSSNAITSGNILRVYSNSSDTTARGVLSIVQDHASASGATPISIQQDGVVSTNYRRLIKEAATGITIWMGNGTTADTFLSATAGDVLINGGSNKPEYCTGTTNWAALV